AQALNLALQSERAVGVVGRGIGLATSTAVMTVFSLELQAASNPKVWNWNNFQQNAFKNLVMFSLLEVTGGAMQTLGRSAEKVSFLAAGEAEASALRTTGSLALKPWAGYVYAGLNYGSRIAAFTASDKITEGTNPKVALWADLLSSAVVDAQMMIAGGGIDL